MFISLLIGLALGVGFMLFLNYIRENDISLNWWQWILTIAAFLYGTFTLETIHAFSAEGAGQGAFIAALVMGVIGAIWAVLLGRFVVVKQ